jgi:hypothetical protein
VVVDYVVVAVVVVVVVMVGMSRLDGGVGEEEVREDLQKETLKLIQGAKLPNTSEKLLAELFPYSRSESV